jgi:hypothetical protein
MTLLNDLKTKLKEHEMHVPPKIWTDFNGRMSSGFVCTWQGLHALVMQRVDRSSRFSLTIQTERSAVLRRFRDNPEPLPYLVQNVGYDDKDTAIKAAEAMLDAIAPKDFKGCPTCGREPL